MIFLRLSLFSVFLFSSSCVYFNTYYNAQKYFRQAEKIRRTHMEEEANRGGERITALRFPQKANRLYEQAAQKAWEVMEKFPESDLVDDAAYLMGRAFYWQGNYLYAIRTFSDLEGKFPDSEFYDRVRYWRALCYEAQGDEQAKELFRSLFTAGKGEVAYQSGYRLGEIEFAAENYAAAAQEYQTTLDAFPQADTRAELYLRLGESFFALEDSARYAESLSAFSRVRQESPTTGVEYKARLLSGKVYYAMGDVESARTTYTDLLRESRFRPFEGQTRLAIGQYYQERHLLDEALHEYEQVRDDFPKSESSAMALFRTGLLYLQEFGDTERAEEYFKEIQAEKSGSEASKLGREILKDLQELERLRRRIHRADSLAAAATETATAIVDTSAGEGLKLEAVEVDRENGPDSLAVLEPDRIDSLLTPAAPLADSLAIENMVPDSLGGKKAELVDLSRTGEESGGGLSSEAEKLMDDLFDMAEIFRHKIEQPDSAAHYYAEITRRFPQSDQVLRALYAIAWVNIELKGDMPAALPFLERIIEDYPSSEHANAARRYLDLEIQITAEELAAEEFLGIEKLLVGDAEAIDMYGPLLDSLVQKYPATRVAARSAFLAARQYENVLGDTLEAESRFDRILNEFPSSPFAKLVKDRRENQRLGGLAKLARGIKSLAGGTKPGEKIEIIAVEPDSADSVILARKHFHFALRAYLRSEFEKALEQCELSLEQMKRNPDVFYYKGNMLSQQGYNQDAIDEYHRALHYNGNYLGAYYGLFNAYLSEGRADSANFYLHEIVSRDSRSFQIQYLVEEIPGLRPSEKEDQDLYILEKLELQHPEDNLSLRQGLLRLEELPLVRKIVAAKYPQGARGDSAEVILDILIGRDGRAEAIEVFKGDEPFKSAAMEAAREYLFYPGEKRAKKNEENKVRVWVELVVPVKPEELAVAQGEDPGGQPNARTGARLDSTFRDTVSGLPELNDYPDNLEALPK